MLTVGSSQEGCVSYVIPIPLRRTVCRPTHRRPPPPSPTTFTPHPMPSSFRRSTPSLPPSTTRWPPPCLADDLRLAPPRPPPAWPHALGFRHTECRMRRGRSVQPIAAGFRSGTTRGCSRRARLHEKLSASSNLMRRDCFVLTPHCLVLRCLCGVAPLARAPPSVHAKPIIDVID